MGQQELMKLFKKEKGWLSSKDIARALKISDASKSLNALVKSKDIIKKYVKKDSHWELQWRVRK